MSVPNTAREAGVDSLYHYERFNPDYFADCLTQKRIHCSDPANLNDPWDCRPWFNEKALENPKALEGLIDWLSSFQPTPALSALSDEAKGVLSGLRDDPSTRKFLLDQFSRKFIEMIPHPLESILPNPGPRLDSHVVALRRQSPGSLPRVLHRAFHFRVRANGPILIRVSRMDPAGIN